MPSSAEAEAIAGEDAREADHTRGAVMIAGAEVRVIALVGARPLDNLWELGRVTALTPFLFVPTKERQLGRGLWVYGGSC